jgi:hypothetical protein
MAWRLPAASMAIRGDQQSNWLTAEMRDLASAPRPNPISPAMSQSAICRLRLIPLPFLARCLWSFTLRVFNFFTYKI